MGGYAAVSVSGSAKKWPPIESVPVYCAELPNVQERKPPSYPPPLPAPPPVAPPFFCSLLLSRCTPPSCGPPPLLHGSLSSVQPPLPVPSPPTPSCVGAAPKRSLPPEGMPPVCWSAHVTPLPPTAVIVIPRRIATAAARRSDYVGGWDGPAYRNAEATEMTVLSTSSTVPLKPPWRPTDAGQISVPSASREHLCTAPISAFAGTDDSSWYHVAFYPQFHGPPGSDFGPPR